jgi:hypothetical protein
MPDQPAVPEGERFSLLLSMERLGGRVEQALSQIATLDTARTDHETRLRAVENEQATARGRGAVLGVLSGIGGSIVVALIAFALGLLGPR